MAEGDKKGRWQTIKSFMKFDLQKSTDAAVSGNIIIKQ